MTNDFPPTHEFFGAVIDELGVSVVQRACGVGKSQAYSYSQASDIYGDHGRRNPADWLESILRVIRERGSSQTKDAAFSLLSRLTSHVGMEMTPPVDCCPEHETLAE